MNPLRLLLFIAFSGPLAAVELVERDIGLVVEMPPTDYAYTLDRPGQSASGDDAYDNALGLWLRGRYAFTGPGDRHGALLGLGLGVERATLTDGDHQLFGIDASAGWGLAISDRLSARAMLRLQAGYADLSINDSLAAPGFSAKGASIGYGAEVGLSFTVSEQVILAADVGWRQSSESLSGDGVDLTLEPSGLAVGVGVWWRLSSRPWRLE